MTAEELETHAKALENIVALEFGAPNPMREHLLAGAESLRREAARKGALTIESVVAAIESIIQEVGSGNLDDAKIVSAFAAGTAVVFARKARSLNTSLQKAEEAFVMVAEHHFRKAAPIEGLK